MNEYEAKQCHEAMLKFLKRHGEDKANTITKQADDEFKSMRNNFIEEEKARIVQDFKNRLAQDEIKLKIQRSASENVARIQKMKTVNSLIEKLYKDSKAKMVQKEKQDESTYKELLKDLIVQGLIKLMEAEVHVRCRKSDLNLV